MNGARLYKIRIDNFRSIERKIEVRLDAPIVLIHGQNGAGKTSLLSALELALTGAVPSMLRADPDYLSQLLHKGAPQGEIVLELKDVERVAKPIEVKITQDGVSNTGPLGARFCKFFSERCYLPQSALTQLLTIYQEADSGVDSLLSRFVSELLGLDRLDALELGLESARDLRNARRLVPSYRDVEQELLRLRREVDSERAQLIEFERGRDEAAGALASPLKLLGIDAPRTGAERLDVERALSSESEEAALIDLADRTRRLIALRREYTRLLQVQTADTRSAVSAYQAAQQELSGWRTSYGTAIQKALADAQSYFPNVELGPNIVPSTALANAIGATTNEIKRLDEVAARLIAARRRLAAFDDADRRSQLRINELNKEIASIAVEAGLLSTLLSELFTHIHGEDCPVCGRDFSEVSKEPLASHVGKKAAELSDQAERLRVLVGERDLLSNQSAARTRERNQIESQGRLDEPLIDIQDRLAKLRNVATGLRSLQSSALEGDRLIRAEAATRPTSSVRESVFDDAESSLRLSLTEQAAFLDIVVDPREQLQDALDRIEAALRDKEVALKARLEARSAATHQLRQFDLLNNRAITSRQKLNTSEREHARVQSAFDAAERIRDDVRRILTAASNTRATIVRQVFNEQLNSLWRDLFVRLAPSEMFLPFFEVPTRPDRRLVPTIRTRHRSGEIGGTPAAMLSAGNLNTAALTLFLALHLSVPAQLPWIILDDPVQSMDEVHITQFAALLRTLAKEQKRQLLIAVHDRPLFDYLALELSPAFAGDELITVELAKLGDGHSWYTTDRRAFEPDTAMKPIAA